MRTPRIKRYLLIIGAMKSGTTSLFSYLAQHPEIAPAKDKEPGFFAVDYRWSQGIDYYEQLFDFDPTTQKWALEASTDYTKRPHCLDVPVNMLKLDGVEYRFIYIMRDPLKRIESHAKQMVRTGTEVGLYRLSKPYNSLDDGISDVAIDTSRYAYQLRPFVEAFGRARLYLTTLEQLTRNPSQVLSEIFDFAEIPQIDVDTSQQLNVSTVPQTSARLRRIGERFPMLRSAGRSILPETARAALVRRFSEKRRFTLTERERAYVLSKLADDLKKLSKEYEIDIDGLWGISSDSL